MKAKHNSTSYRAVALTSIILLLYILVIFLSLFFGQTTHTLDVTQMLQVLFTPDASVLSQAIWNIRLPRLLACLLLGAALAVAGYIAQCSTINPLASPQTLGLIGTSEFFMLVSMIMLPQLIMVNQLAAFFGALAGGIITLGLSLRISRSYTSLALIGLLVHILFTSLTQILILLSDTGYDVIFWLQGSVASVRWETIFNVAVPIILCLALALFLSRKFFLLTFGKMGFTSLGGNYKIMLIVAALLVALLTGLSVNVAGPVGFIGLIVPHLANRFWGASARWGVFYCIITGALLFSASDLIGKMVFSPYEIPVGTVIACVGGLSFIMLIISGGKRFRSQKTLTL